MEMSNLLSKQEIDDLMNDVPLWKNDTDTLTKEVVCSNFVSVIGLVNSISIIAEKYDHHPDLLIYGWNKLRITLSTHNKGGLTEFDFKLAKQIDNLNF